MAKQRVVALVGSSGGGAASLGQYDALALLGLARSELASAGIDLGAVQFVTASLPLDTASDGVDASLWVMDSKGEISCQARGTLEEVNGIAHLRDSEIAMAIRRSSEAAPPAPSLASAAESTPLRHLCLDGLIVVSSDVGGVNRQAVEAARDTGIPMVGTGGSSISKAIAMGCKVVGSSGGSVATTNKSKAVSYTAGLSGHWSLPYNPEAALRPARAGAGEGGWFAALAPASAFGACLPTFLGVMVATWGGKFVSRLLLDEEGGGGVHALLAALLEASLGKEWADAVAGREAFDRMTQALPVVVGAVAARQASALGDVATAAGILAGTLCREDVVTALIAGAYAGQLCSTIAAACLTRGVPATALTILSTGVAGIVSGVVSRLLLLPWAGVVRELATATWTALDRVESLSIKSAVGALMGLAMCWGSKVGMYHWLFLPIICLEMQGGKASIWGTIDLCALCMVAAGVCAAHLLRPRESWDAPLARRGLYTNLVFGDFVEVAYPFMDRDPACSVAGYLGSGLSGAIVAAGGARSSAYLPLPLALAVSDEYVWVGVAAVAAFLPPFIAGLLLPRRLEQRSPGHSVHPGGSDGGGTNLGKKGT